MLKQHFHFLCVEKKFLFLLKLYVSPENEYVCVFCTCLILSDLWISVQCFKKFLLWGFISIVI